MKRDTEQLSEGVYDLLVIGGGVLGACVARDATLRGLSVALVERGDFASGTSANSLKIVHGGFRYLQNLDFRRMRESIKERSTWLRIAPHLVEPLPILVPSYRHGLQRRSVLRAAAVLSDILAWDRNRGLLPDRYLPVARPLSRSECLDLVPQLDHPALTGGIVFYDAQFYNSERLVLELLEDAVGHGARIANYAEARGRRGDEGGTEVVSVADRLGEAEFDLRARVIVNAAGPAAPVLAAKLTGRAGAASTRFSVALNLMVPPLGHSVAFAFPGRRQRSGGLLRPERRQLFFVPWRERSLIGTAHYAFDGDPAEFARDERHVEAFLDEINATWPGSPFDRADIALVHVGLLPTATGTGESGVRLLRRHRIFDHGLESEPALITAVSVKYTTARLVAEEVVDLVFQKLDRESPACRTAVDLLPGAIGYSEAKLMETARSRAPEALEDETVRHLVRSYGGRLSELLAHSESVDDWSLFISSSAPVIKAQLVYGVRHEMALRSEDLVWRRTEIGARGLASEGVIRQASELLRREGVTAVTPAVPDHIVSIEDSATDQ